jgi:hypothetical protein
MPKGHARLLIAIAAAGAILSQGVSAKADKASTKLMQKTATGTHYKKTTLTPDKPKTPVAKKPTTSAAADKTTKPPIKIEGVDGEAKDKDHKSWAN